MSFRIRIFLIAIVTVSCIIMVVMSFSWSRIMTLELDQLDARLCIEAKRLIPRQIVSNLPPRQRLAGEALTKDLAEKLRIASPQQLLVFVQSPLLGIMFQTGKTDVAAFIQQQNWSSKLNQPLPATTEISTPAIDSPHNDCQLASFEFKQQDWRASWIQRPGAQSLVAVDIGATTVELKHTLHSALVVIVPLALLLSAAGAWMIASYTIQPMNRLHLAMQMVTKNDLSHRLSKQNEDKEFQVLIDAYNQMLDRLEQSFGQISRFTADAAHELKTPLTILRGKMEQAVLNQSSTQIDLNEILDDVGNLSAITRKLLLLSQADAGSLALHLETIDVTELLDELLTDFELMSEQVELRSTVERDLTLKGDSTLLSQLFNNLLSNALLYCRPDAGISMKAFRQDNTVIVQISNHCRPILATTRQQLFDRFYRGDPEHNLGISGSGLGLGLSREIARAHGGDLQLEPTPDNVVTLRLTLPSPHQA